jgi:hypothetical protein
LFAVTNDGSLMSGQRLWDNGSNSAQIDLGDNPWLNWTGSGIGSQANMFKPGEAVSASYADANLLTIRAIGMRGNPWQYAQTRRDTSNAVCDEPNVDRWDCWQPLTADNVAPAGDPITTGNDFAVGFASNQAQAWASDGQPINSRTWKLQDGFVPTGAQLAMLGGSVNHAIVATGSDGGVYRKIWAPTAVAGWARFQCCYSDGFRVHAGTAITAPTPFKYSDGYGTELFVIGYGGSGNGLVYFTRYSIDADRWSGQWVGLRDDRFPDGFTVPFATPHQPVAAVPDNHIAALRYDGADDDLLLVTGLDGVVHVTYVNHGQYLGHWDALPLRD